MLPTVPALKLSSVSSTQKESWLINYGRDRGRNEIINLSVEILLHAESAFWQVYTSKNKWSQEKIYIRAAAAYLPAPHNRNLQWKCVHSPPKLSRDLFYRSHWLLHKNWWKFLKLLALELGIRAGCVSGLEQLAWKLTQNQLQRCNRARTPPSQQPYAFPLWLQSCSKS